MTTLAPVAERRAALVARHPRWEDRTLDAFLAQAVAASPERPLVLTDDATWSYAEVAERAERYARGLRAQGVGPGDRVALVMANHPEFVPLAFAVWRLGASAIPVNFSFRAEELAYVVSQSACRVLVTMTTFRDLDYPAMLDAVAPGWEAGHPERFPDLAAVVTFGPSGRDGVLTLDELARRGAEDGAALPPSVADPHEPAVVMYTSGTTGLPKGVLQSHDNLLRCAYGSAYHRAYEDGRRVLFALPLYHAFALVEGLLAAMWVGGAVVPQLVFDPVATFSAVARHRPSEALFVPTMSVALVEHPAAADHDLSSLVAVLSGAAPTPVRVWQQLKDVFGLEEVFTGYGMTELSASTTITAPDAPLEVVERTVGIPKEAGPAGVAEYGGRICAYKTVDPYTGEDLPEGAEGELCARGPVATSGYFAKPEETAALLLPGGWVRSGDLGRVRPDGYLELTGRSKELYKTGGELVAPKEVEEVLTSHPAVAQAYVVGLPDDRWGEVGAAWVVLAPGASCDEEELVAYASARLAKFKRPRHVLFTTAADLPATATGKVQKFRLVEEAQKRLGRTSPYR